MQSLAEADEARLVFPAWSIVVPVSFAETFVSEGSYWHAWDASRSVSLSSSVLTDRGRPVEPAAIVARCPARVLAPAGSPIDTLPPGLVGWAAIVPVEEGRASQALTGLLAVRGRVLVATITSDDLGWARRTWRSIRSLPAPLPSRRERRRVARR
jgi:hypothetical protein